MTISTQTLKNVMRTPQLPCNPCNIMWWYFNNKMCVNIKTQSTLKAKMNYSFSSCSIVSLLTCLALHHLMMIIKVTFFEPTEFCIKFPLLPISLDIPRDCWAIKGMTRNFVSSKMLYTEYIILWLYPLWYFGKKIQTTSAQKSWSQKAFSCGKNASNQNTQEDF